MVKLNQMTRVLIIKVGLLNIKCHGPMMTLKFWCALGKWGQDYPVSGFPQVTQKTVKYNRSSGTQCFSTFWLQEYMVEALWHRTAGMQISDTLFGLLPDFLKPLSVISFSKFLGRREFGSCYRNGKIVRYAELLNVEIYLWNDFFPTSFPPN